ncbi:piggyBac transposable element-derived protein 4-like [Hyperolius riggenbachi]|uniref:piggyBac transposable element-derived protein 4-like n=1 Tax=Hyperolius riggenbachi TaxID=752182 RepID=UPI0035A2643D
MAKRLYSAQEAADMLQQDSSSSTSEEEELEESDADWIPDSESSFCTESDSDTDSAGPSTAQQPRREGEMRAASDTDSASEEGSPVATTSSDNARGQRAARPRQSMPARVARQGRRQPLPYELLHPQWSPPNMEAPNLPLFTARSGIQADTGAMQPIDFFHLFFTEDFLQHVCEQTNIYALQSIAKKPTSTLAARWTPTTPPEFKVFLGLIFNMALNPRPQQRLYWSRDSIDSMPIFSATMTRCRFQLLMSCMHFNNNAHQLAPDNPAHDRLFKLRPLIDHLNNTFSEVYTPEQNIAIDESLVPFHGRLSIKQYIPSKRSRYGIKLYRLCESGTGYTYKFTIYEGKDSLIEPAVCPPYMSTTERIVLDLIHPLLYQGYHLYVENFYTSVPLFKFLFSAQTPACGTIRSNRKGLPAQVVSKKLKKGEICSQRSNELLALKFRDKRDVFILTTIHSEATTTVRSRTRRENIVKPVAIVAYNKSMGAVDLADQMLAPYRMDRKRKTWYKKVALQLFQVCLQNAFVLYAKSGHRDSFIQYQRRIIRTLIYHSGHPAPNPDQLQSENVLRLHGNHFPAPIPPTASKKYPQKRCKICRRSGVRRETRYHCPKCPSKAGLCLNPCFEIYHTAAKY